MKRNKHKALLLAEGESVRRELLAAQREESRLRGIQLEEPNDGKK